MALSVGTRVKPSGYSLRSKWDYYLAQGEYSRKQRAREAYDMAAARRGTIAIVHPPSGKLNTARCDTYTVQWSDGSTSQCMPSMIEAIPEGPETSNGRHTSPGYVVGNYEE